MNININKIQILGGFLQYSATDTSNNFYDFFTSNSFDSNDQKDAIDQCSQMGKLYRESDVYFFSRTTSI